MSLGRIKGKKEADFLRSATIGRHDVTSRYHGDVSRYHADGHYNGREGDPRQRETAFPPRDTLSDKLRYVQCSTMVYAVFIWVCFIIIIGV